MSINKGKTKGLVRHCGQHGYGCTRGCSFTVGQESKRSRWSALEKRKISK